MFLFPVWTFEKPYQALLCGILFFRFFVFLTFILKYFFHIMACNFSKFGVLHLLFALLFTPLSFLHFC